MSRRDGTNPSHRPGQVGRMILFLLGLLALLLGLGLFLWRGRPMLFALILGGGVFLWCLLWALGGSRLIHGILLTLLVLVLLVEGILEGAILSRSGGHITGEPQAIVVLGAAVWEDGPSPMLVSRLDAALSYWESHPDLPIVVSGGQGSDETESEAAAMKAYLTSRGVPEDQILLEPNAYNTAENLSFSAALLEEAGHSTQNLLVVSNDYHLCRVELLARRQGLEISTLPAPTPGSLLVKVYYYARETLGLVKSWAMD